MYTLIYMYIEGSTHIKRKYVHKTTSDHRPIDKKDETTFREYILKKKKQRITGDQEKNLIFRFKVTADDYDVNQSYNYYYY